MVSLWQHGVANVVAMQGTGAPGPYVLEHLAKSVNNFILCFDRDIRQNAISGPSPPPAPWPRRVRSDQRRAAPQGKDPDDLRREGVEAFRTLIPSRSPADWTIDFWAADLDLDRFTDVTEARRPCR